VEEGFLSEEEALKEISKIFKIPFEKISSIEPKIMMVEEPLKVRWLKVYKLNEISFGIGYWREGYGDGRRKPLYGIWVFKNDKMEMISKEKIGSTNYKLI